MIDELSLCSPSTNMRQSFVSSSVKGKAGTGKAGADGPQAGAVSRRCGSDGMLVSFGSPI
jgi:hypothetical protein